MDATEFIRNNQRLERQMQSSLVFEKIKETNAFVVDGKTEYVIGGDIAGTEEELYMDSLARGSQLASHTEGCDSLEAEDRLFWLLFTELPEELKALLRRRFR